MGQRGRPRSPGLLTPQDVLALIRSGQSNAQIGDTLGISVETVKQHVSQVLAKLGVESREEAATWREQKHGQFGWLIFGSAAVSFAAASLAFVLILAAGSLRAGGGDSPGAGLTETGAASGLPRTQVAGHAIDDVYYNIALRVPGFAGMRYNDQNNGFDVFMSQDAEVETVRTGIVQVMRNEPTFAYALNAYESWPIVLTRVRYDWITLYEWYQSVGWNVPGAVSGDIDESRNRLIFGIADDDPGDATSYLRAAGLPDDSFGIDTGVVFEDD